MKVTQVVIITFYLFIPFFTCLKVVIVYDIKMNKHKSQEQLNRFSLILFSCVSYGQEKVLWKKKIKNDDIIK